MNVKDTRAILLKLGVPKEFSGQSMLAGTGYRMVANARNELGAPTLAQWLQPQYSFKTSLPDTREPPDFSKQGTYSDCVDWWVIPTDTGLRLFIRFYDGDNMYGQRVMQRCEWAWDLDDTHDKFAEYFHAPLQDVIEAWAENKIAQEDKEALRLRQQAKIVALYNAAGVER